VASSLANTGLLEGFYASFARRDGAAMASCYAPAARFHDPVFDLAGDEIGAMWKMFCARGGDLALEWREIDADATTGTAHWEARYTFSVTGRPVHNVIDAKFTFRDGLIATHEDRFDLWRWCRMALGVKGTLLGWTPFVQRAVREQGRRALDTFIAREAP
jgi:uncharacterized protein